MKKKKPVGKDIVEQAIKQMNRVETLEELEQILGVKLTNQLLSEINKQMNRMKKKNAEAKRKYAATGKRELVQEQKAAQQSLEQLHQKFIDMREKREHRKNPLDEQTQLAQERQKIWSEIEEGNYWLDNQAKDMFSYYQHLTVHGDRIDALQDLLLYYIEDAQSLLEIEVSTTEAMHEAENEKRVGKRNPLMPWRTLSTTSPKREFYIPYEEKLQQIITKAEKVKTMIEYLARLEAIESRESELQPKPEMTTDQLMDKRDFIIPKNDIEREYQRILNKIDQGTYMKEWQSSYIHQLPEEITALLHNMYQLPRYELKELVSIAKSVIKTKRQSIKKGESIEGDFEKDFLRRIENAFKEIMPVMYMDEEDTRAYYDILRIMMQDDRNYEQIKALLQIDEFLRARNLKIVKEGQGRNIVRHTEREHIILYALDCFVKNYKLKLQDQGLPYIEPGFYKEIIKIMIRKGIELTPQELAKYSKKLDEFREYIKRKGYQSTSLVMEDITEINNVRHAPQKKDKTNKPSFQTTNDSQDICFYWLTAGAKQNRKQGYREFIPSTMTSTFQIEGIEPFAFSIDYQSDGSKTIGVHILDTTKILDGDDYIAKEIIEGKIKLPPFNQNQIYPTYSFQSGIDSENELYRLPMVPANIFIGNHFTAEDINRYREIPELKDFINWLRLIQNDLVLEENIYQENGMKSLITTYVSTKIAARFHNQRLPFIYKSTLPDEELLIAYNHNETCEILSKIPKQKAHQIYDILDSEDIASSYYVPEKTENSRIELDSTTESGIYLLTTLHRLRTGRYNPDEAGKEISTLLTKLNKDHEYIPSCLSDHNDKKITRMVKAYKKSLRG